VPTEDKKLMPPPPMVCILFIDFISNVYNVNFIRFSFGLKKLGNKNKFRNTMEFI
jgi:hypothetical protein